MTTPDDNDELRARLRAADPARGLTSLNPLERRRAVLAATRPTPTARRRRRAWGLTGAAVATGVGTLLVVNVLTPAETSTTLDYGGTGGPAAICGVVSADVLAQRELAFQAEVTAVDKENATLQVEEVFGGEVGSEVIVPQSQGQVSEIDLGLLEVGQTYLIAADGTTIATCGQSGLDTPQLRDLYQEAFS